MTRDETRALLALAAATTRDWTPTSIDVDAWHVLLDDLPADDCRQALFAHARQTHHRPVPADLRTGVKRIRADRLARAPYTIPDADPDDVDGYLRALRAGTQRAAGGEQPRDLRALENVFPSVPPGHAPPPRGLVERFRASLPRRSRPRDLTHAEAMADLDRMAEKIPATDRQLVHTPDQPREEPHP